MKCDKAQEFFSDYIENTLDRPMTVALESHLNGCEMCSADVASLRGMWAVLDQVPAVEPPADFVWNTTNRIRNEMLNRREAEQAKALPWWKRLTPAQTFSYAGIAALLIVGLAFPVRNAVQTWGWNPFGNEQTLNVRPPVLQVTPPQFNVQLSGQAGAVVTITPTSEMPGARVIMTNLFPVAGQLQGRPQVIGRPQQDLAARQPVSVGANGSRAVKIAVTARVGSTDTSFERTLIQPGQAPAVSSLQGAEPYFALYQVSALTGQAMLVDGGLTNPVTVNLQGVAPQQALDQVLAQVGARAEQLPNGVLVISAAR